MTSYIRRKIKLLPPSRYANMTGKIIGQETKPNLGETFFYIELDKAPSKEEEVIITLVDYVSFLTNGHTDSPTTNLIKDLG